MNFADFLSFFAVQFTHTHTTEPPPMATLRDKLATKAQTVTVLGTAQDKLAVDLKLIVDDQKAVADATAADRAADKDVADTIDLLSPEAGEVIDNTPDERGMVTMHKRDQSPQGYHEYKVPTLDTPLPEPTPPQGGTPPDEPAPVPVPDASTTGEV